MEAGNALEGFVSFVTSPFVSIDPSKRLSLSKAVKAARYRCQSLVLLSCAWEFRPDSIPVSQLYSDATEFPDMFENLDWSDEEDHPELSSDASLGNINRPVVPFPSCILHTIALLVVLFIPHVVQLVIIRMLCLR